MGTPLQEVYDNFFSKIDEDLYGKEGKVFEYFKSAKSKSYKTVVHSLNYKMTFPDDYEGEFVELLNQDEIELLGLKMKYEYLSNKESYLIGLKQQLGTKDFNNLPDKKRELDGIQNSMRLLKEDIKELEQQFNTYKYS
jgi:hypothetical protein